MAWKPWKDLAEDEQIGNLANGYLISVTPEEREWFNSWFIAMNAVDAGIVDPAVLAQIPPEATFEPGERVLQALSLIHI